MLLFRGPLSRCDVVTFESRLRPAGFIIAPSRYETDSLTPLYLDSRSSSTRSLVHSLFHSHLSRQFIYLLRQTCSKPYFCTSYEPYFLAECLCHKSNCFSGFSGCLVGLSRVWNNALLPRIGSRPEALLVSASSNSTQLIVDFDLEGMVMISTKTRLCVFVLEEETWNEDIH